MSKLAVKTKKIILWGQSKLGVDLGYVLRGGFWMVTLQVVLSLLGLGVTFLLTKNFGKEVFGQYRYVISLTTLFAIATLPGMDSSVVRSVSRGESFSWSKMLRTRIRWGFLGSVAAIGFAVYYFLSGNISLAIPLIIVAVTVPFSESWFTYTSLFSGKYDFFRVAWYQILSQAIRSLIVVIVLLMTKDVVWVLAAFFFSEVLSRGAAHFFALVKYGHAVKGGGGDSTVEVIEYGKKLSAVQIVTRVVNQMDKLLVWHYLGPVVLATYAVALTIPVAVRGATGVLTQLALPKISNHDWDDFSMRRVFLKKMFFYLLALLGLYGAYSLAAPWLFRILFPDYLEGLSAVVLLGSLIVLAPLRNMFDQIFIAAKKVKQKMFYRIFEFFAYLIAFSGLIWLGVNPIIVAALALPIKFFAVILLQMVLLLSWDRT